MFSRSISLLLALGVWGFTAVPALADSHRTAKPVPNEPAENLALSDAQRSQIAQLREREEKRVLELRRALGAIELEPQGHLARGSPGRVSNDDEE